MPDVPPPPTRRFRLDGVALALLAAGVVTAVAVGSYAPAAGRPNRLGDPGDAVAARLVEPLGWAAAVLLAGWFAVAGLLVVTRRPGRVSARALGWAGLTASAAVAADAVTLPYAAVAGPGGTIGAFLRLKLDAAGGADARWVAVGGLTLASLVLAADWLVAGVARRAWAALRRIGKAAAWGNDKVAAGGEVAFTGLGRAAAALNRPAAPNPPRKDAKKKPTPAAEPQAEPPAANIPIHSHTERPVLRAVPAADPPTDYEFPPLTLLDDPEPFPVADHEQKLRDMAALLEKTFQDFNLNIKVVGIHTGPVITQYEVALETGLRLSKVTNLADDLALNLRVASVRVVAPLPGRNTVGIEVPNEVRQTVHLKELVSVSAGLPKVAKFKLPIFLGKDVEGKPLAYDLATMPHLLIAGRTGTGKSVCLNTIILGFLLTRSPDDCRLILIDPKKVELTEYAQIPHLMTPVVKDDKKADAILAWAVDKMEERYEWLHRARVRNVAAYNDLSFEEVVRRVNPDSEEERRNIPRKMPYIVLVIDEVGDLIMKMKKEIETSIILLAQKSRAAGIHLILATQKPTVDVITGLIKSNLPARICFQVTNRSDSAVVLDEKGAERLLGQGDMLFLQPGSGTMVRAQGAFVNDGEIERVVNAVATDAPNYDTELLNLKTREQQDGTTANDGGAAGDRPRDPLYDQAVEIVIREQRGSTSLLQRALGIGYGKASRFIDYMAEDGLVGGFNGSNARQVMVTPEEWDGRKNAG